MSNALAVSGRSRLAQAAIELSDSLNLRVSCLITAGAADSYVRDLAVVRGMHVVSLDSDDLRRGEFSAWADHKRQCHCQYLTLTFDYLLPHYVFSAYRRAVNLHLSLLPAYPGRDSLKRSIEGGSKIIGATIHELTDMPDSGPVVAQCAVPAPAGGGMLEAGWRLFHALLPMYLNHLSDPTGQQPTSAVPSPEIGSLLGMDGAILVPEPPMSVLSASAAWIRAKWPHETYAGG